MFTRARPLLIALALAGTGCGDDPPPSADGVGDLVAPTPRPSRNSSDDLYDADGVPLESDQRVAGLVLPRGLTLVEALETDRRHVYQSQIPPERLLRFFGPRLITIDIERRGQAVIYRKAQPLGVRGGVVTLDVTIEPSSQSRSRVEIVELPPPPPEGTVIPAEEIRRHFEAEGRQAE